MKHIKLYEDFINEAERVPTQLQPSDFRKYFSDIHYDTVKRQYDRDTTPEIAQADNGKWYEVSSAYNRWDERIVKLKSVKAPKNEANESTELDEALNEISLSSAGVKSFLTAMYTNADAIKKLGFKSFKDLVGYIKSNDLHDWDDLRAEVKELGIVIAESEDVNESTIQYFKPTVLDKKNAVDAKLFKKLMPRTSSTTEEAMERIWHFEDLTMFVHYQYHIVKPNGNKINRPTYRLHQSQYWLTGAYDNQIKNLGLDPKEGVNTTLITIFDITDPANEVNLGKAWVATREFLDELNRVFEVSRRES